jgi:hypothetical protein
MMFEPPLTSHQNRAILPTILHHNKGIETYLSKRKKLTVAKKGIETCFSMRKNFKHVLVGTDNLNHLIKLGHVGDYFIQNPDNPKPNYYCHFRG